VNLVFDTNVLFAAHISRGKCAMLYELALATETIISSPWILDELREKLVLKAKLPGHEATDVRRQVEANAKMVDPVTLPSQVCRDPDDDHVLGTAVAANADLIVTGDQDLLILREYRGIPIITPAECLGRMTQG
jgi:putative PIN family toxin of toxin-antitoxin system